jgi:hypothetical protein
MVLFGAWGKGRSSLSPQQVWRSHQLGFQSYMLTGCHMNLLQRLVKDLKMIHYMTILCIIHCLKITIRIGKKMKR